MSPDTYYKKPYIDQFVGSRTWEVFLKGNWEITYCVSERDLMKCYASLLASTSDSKFCLCLHSFAMSSVRFIIPRKPCQCRTALPVIWSLASTSVLWMRSWDLALNSCACLWSHTMFAPAVVVCSRVLLVPAWYWISMLFVGKERPFLEEILGILYLKRFFSIRGAVPRGKVRIDWGIQLMHLKCYSTNSFSSLFYVCKPYCSPRQCMQASSGQSISGFWPPLSLPDSIKLVLPCRSGIVFSMITNW